MADNGISNNSGTSSSVQYVYLDFDGEHATYRNTDLRMSFSVTVQNPDFSDAQKQAILNGLKEKYASSGIVFTTEKPAVASYSTLYFGQSNAFQRYGDFFGVSETFDEMNRRQNDNAYVLLDKTYSTDQVLSVSSQMLDHILGNSYMVDGAVSLRNYAANSYLLSTEWSQGEPYSKYCPVDPDTQKRSVAGCTNTAAAQVIYYWLETGLLDLSLTLGSSDGYTENGITIDAESANASQYGYLSFSETNKLLSDFKLGNSDCIAALCFAAGVVQGASYSSGSTATPYKKTLLTRAGLESGIVEYYTDESGSRYFKEKYGGLTDSGLEILVNELLAGRPVLASIYYGSGKSEGEEEHAIVIDGYNSSTKKFHLNFGWGGRDNGWYSAEELNDNYGIYDIFTGITPDVSPRLTVASMSFKANAVNRDDDVTLNIGISNQGKTKSVQATAYVYCGRKLLSTLTVASMAAGGSRSLSCTFSASSLSLGSNSITVRVYTSGGAGRISSVSKTVKVYDGAVTNADNSWKAASTAGSWTKTVAEYDSEGSVAETVLAKDEYVGYHDTVDYRELTLAHAGKYTFTLSGVTNDLEMTLCRLNDDKLKTVKSLTVYAPSTGGRMTDVPLESGTYYISVKAVNAETHGDSDYRLVFSGGGYLKANNADDWPDLKEAGSAGNVPSVGVIDGGSEEIVAGEWVGLGDTVDYRHFMIASPAKLSFRVTASDAVKFTIYELTEKINKQGEVTYALKILQSRKVKAGATELTKGLLLPGGNEPEKYYFSVESTNAKKGGSADYEVVFNLSGSEFFTKGDNSDDWTDLKKKGAAGAAGDAGTIGEGRESVLEGWVGYCDEVDYAKITLESAAELFFTLGATDASKFIICRLDGKADKNDNMVYSLKSLQTTKLSKLKRAAGYGAETKGLLLEAGEYYIAMQSTNAAKGGSADYTVDFIKEKAVFFTKGDKSDDWDDLKTKGAAGAVGDFGEVDGKSALLLENWVGFGDTVDYCKFTLDAYATLAFVLNATDKTKFTVYRLAEKTGKTGAVTYSLKKVQSVTLNKQKGSEMYAAAPKARAFEAGEYYIAMQSTNAKKGGSADYTVSLDLDACVFSGNPLLDAQEASALGIGSVPASAGLPDLNRGLYESGAEAVCAASCTDLLQDDSVSVLPAVVAPA